MKRRFPGDQGGPPGRPHDPRIINRGARGPPHNSMARGPPPGRFHGGGRGGPRPPFPARGPGPLGGRGPPGRGPPPPPPNIFGRGPPPPMGPGMGRGMPQRAHNHFGRGPGPMMGGRRPLPGGRGHMGRGAPMGPGMGPSMMPPNGPPPPRGGPMYAGRQPFAGRAPQRPGMSTFNPPNQHGPGRGPPNGIPGPMHASFRNQPLPSVPPPPLTNLPPPPFAHQGARAGPPGSPYKAPPNTLAPPAPVAYSGYAAVATVPAAPAAPVAAMPVTPLKQGTLPTQKQIDEAWTEHTAPSGVKFYHNPLLNESTYTKPDVFGKRASSTETPSRQWQEYEDKATGKKYYSDGVTTTWEKPAALSSTSDNASEEAAEPPTKKKKKDALEESPYSSKEEAVTAFKGFLLTKDIAPSQKWNEVVKNCSSNRRWTSFEEILSVGERRQALAEYQTKRANEIRDQERQERIRAKEAYSQLLTDVLPKVGGFSAWTSQFSDVRSALAKDDRFHAVADEGTRESLFHDLCEEFRKRDERKKRSKKREVHEAFVSFLSEKHEAGVLTFASTWDSFLNSISSEDKEDSRFQISDQMNGSDREVYFADYVIELQQAEDDKRRRIRDARRRAEIAQREEYIATLHRLSMEGRIRPSTRWRSIEEFVTADESFQPVYAQNRDAPHELFDEFVDVWDDTYRRERAFLGRLLSHSDTKEAAVKVGMTLDDFTVLLLKCAEYSADIYNDTKQIIGRDEPVSTARLYYEELIAKVNEKTQRHARRRAQDEDSSEDEGEIVEEAEEPIPKEQENNVITGTSHVDGPDSAIQLQVVDGCSDAQV